MSTTQLTNLESELQGLVLRIKTLESDVASLKQQSTEGSAAKDDRASRWQRIQGSMKDDPDFAEIVRLGREYRKSYFTD